MNIAQIEANIHNLISSFSEETFIFELLLAYGKPKASITRLQKGNLNMAKTEGEICWKKVIFFKVEKKSKLHKTLAELEENITHKERFVIVTDYKTIVAVDTKTKDKLDCAIKDLAKHYDFFLPLAGMEKAQHVNENPADVKAAEKMAKLFDIIKKDNPDNSPEFIHGLNLFLSRLLFCYFAEDTHIFEDNQFTNFIDSHTQVDGSDVNTYLDKFFDVLNTPKNKRKKTFGELPEYLNSFPYVNGGLFRDSVPAPKFSKTSRAALINSGEQDWSAINPDIFGSMFQAVIGAEQRGNLGQHYTSVPNIMKVIEPLFLSELYEELEKAGKSKKKLDALLHRIHNIKIFDPACGSGNFLIIAYKELRILEMKIFKAGDMMALSGIQLSQFYGIEIDDFAGEIAKLSLWLAEHQMNVEFRKEFGRTNPTLPLSEAGNIVQGNACRLDWEEVCPKTNKFGEPAEVYILGNPPYLGSRMQQAAQKADMDYVFSFLKTYRDLDYISIWFYKGAQYIKGINSKCSFVSTNSICQGLQVGLLWPHIFKLGIEINFAHTSFKWTNNAKSKAGVTVVIIGLRNKNNKDSYLYSSQTKRVVNNINGYLVAGTNCIIEMRSTPISNFSIMQKGSQPTDGGNLILSEQEKERIVNKEPDSLNFIKKYIGSQEYIRGQIRYCIWIEDDQLEDAMKIESIKNRVQQVKYMRVKSTKLATQKLSEKPYAFGECRYKKTSAIIIPSVSSERRDYIPIGYLHDDTVISNLAFVIYNAEPFLIGVLSSNIHMIWVRTISGYLGTSLRYSNTLSYNTFPFPPISEQRKNEITQAVFRILEEREKHSDKTLAQLYDPDKMPDGLREAHRQNDLIIEKCYRSKPFTSDEERLEYLFKLYEKMIAEEKS
ncbi:MAG: class I SAM-dependent DNA methyltransferase [Leptospiraceae bacterium]|nr:class I SAM-dependent DNA methyltransferase [Leptospiraceae bacterium]MCP5498878.1 class I SAM-dependent DNA methyltransferase [Leptospiraceae bacterium]